MKIYLLVSNVILLIAAILLLFFPEVLIRLNKWFNQVLISTDEKILSLRKPIGIVLILVVIFLTCMMILFPMQK